MCVLLPHEDGIIYELLGVHLCKSSLRKAYPAKQNSGEDKTDEYSGWSSIGYSGSTCWNWLQTDLMIEGAHALIDSGIRIVR